MFLFFSELLLIILCRLLLFEIKLKSVLGVEFDHDNWTFVPNGCEALISRIQKNFTMIERIFSVHYEIHHGNSLTSFVEDAVKNSLK
jgi:hypothetical protein